MTPEQANRLAKATLIADVLDAVLIETGATVDGLTEECWRLADQVVAAKQRRDVRPASERTRALAVSILNERAQWRQPDADPFAGLVDGPVPGIGTTIATVGGEFDRWLADQKSSGARS